MLFRIGVLFLTAFALLPARATALERLCDPSFEDCRTPLLNLIRAETVGIDAAWWFMEDSRFATELIKRWQAGVPVRVIIDPRANSSYPLNADMLRMVKDAGIPMRQKVGGGILHWKMMLFAGQNTVEFSGANYSPNGFVPNQPYVDYVDEAIYFTDDPDVVQSFKKRYDSIWADTVHYSDYANVTSRAPRYPTTYTIHPDLNFPPTRSGEDTVSQDFALRSVRAYNAETVGIDAIMYRITDRRHTDALIAAIGRGVRVRLITEPKQYRDPSRLWHSWNVDRLFAAGAQIKHRAHLGLNHEKNTVLHGQGLTIYGSSNWTGPSANSQLEHNYFTKKTAFFNWSVAHFERKWNNSHGEIENEPFVPLPPDRPVYQSPSDGAQNQPLTVTLKWHAGYWAHKYDIYFGTTPEPPLLEADKELGPSQSSRDFKSYTVPGLTAGTTYYWRIVSKTMAASPERLHLTRSGPVQSFRTEGGSLPGGGANTVVLYASKAGVRQGWNIVSDGTAAGGSRLENPNVPLAKVSAPLADPSQYFEMGFDATAGVPYRIWIRGKAASNYWGNDSVFVQFSGSMTSTGSPTWRIGTTSGTTITLEDCSGCGLSNWGWQDNGYGTGVLGPVVYFASSGPQTIRVQVREDGLSIDQIVISPDTYLSSAPGAAKNDGTILAENGGSTSSPDPGPEPAPEPAPAPAGAGDIVLHASDGTISGQFAFVSDATAASGRAAVLPNTGRTKVSTPSATTADYVELTFTPQADTPYRLWLRGRATNDFYGNDSVYVQFSGSVDSGGNPVWRIGSTSATEVNLEACSSCGLSNWGWQDNGWGSPTALGPQVRFEAAVPTTIRIQNREDGFLIDQIVLSPGTWLTTAPGTDKNDTTILSKTP